MKKVHVISITLISLLFLSSFGFVEYSVIQPKFNISINDTTKTNQNATELVRSRNFSKDQSTDQKPDEEVSSEKTLVSWTEYFAMAIKTVFLKLVSLLISFFIW